MFRRPSPADGEEELLKEAEKFRSSESFQPSAKLVNAKRKSGQNDESCDVNQTKGNILI